MKQYINTAAFMLARACPSAPEGNAISQARTMAQVVARLTGDLVVTLSPQGQVLDVVSEDACLEADPAMQDWARAWIGRPWVETVAPECRLKAQRMLQELAASGHARRREINHPAHDGHPVVRAWTAVQLGGWGHAGPSDGSGRREGSGTPDGTGGTGEQALSLALGHDLAPARAQVERLRAAQSQVEQSYWDEPLAPPQDETD